MSQGTGGCSLASVRTGRHRLIFRLYDRLLPGYKPSKRGLHASRARPQRKALFAKIYGNVFVEQAVCFRTLLDAVGRVHLRSIESSVCLAPRLTSLAPTTSRNSCYEPYEPSTGMNTNRLLLRVLCGLLTPRDRQMAQPAFSHHHLLRILGSAGQARAGCQLSRCYGERAPEQLGQGTRSALTCPDSQSLRPSSQGQSQRLDRRGHIRSLIRTTALVITDAKFVPEGLTRTQGCTRGRCQIFLIVIVPLVI